MKRILSSVCRKAVTAIALLMSVYHAQAQPTTVRADPALISFDVTTLGDVSVNANQLLTTGTYKLKLYALNLDQVTAIPDGTSYIKIGLGSKLILDPSFNLATAPFSNYFTWSSLTSGGQVQIYGTIHTPLPANFTAQLSFNVKASTSTQTGTSTVTGNFLISNDNPAYFFSDNDGTNNTASLQYGFSANIPVPVTITKFTAVNKNCSLNVNWSTAQELNVDRYEVEISKDGINFIKAATVSAVNNTDYGSLINLTDAMKAPVLYVRLKSIDLDGSFKYSSVVLVSGTCGTKLMPVIYGYPNPLSRGSSFINIGARDGLFNGNYDLVLSDLSGKVYTQKTVSLANALSFRLDVPQALAPGKYFVRLQKPETGEKAVVQFEKL